ncbi:hypothetical protein LCGC14_0400880 [marine sediment metagenome]|uniref:Uncharacterized protein n=1 Tax=marine sediment metagenome TaxID=412755 RepID=A0A0F9SWW2_9ZZZZ
MNEHEIAELAVGDENRCVYTVHANGDWGDYRCEIVVEHSGPHAIGLRHHAVPLVNTLETKLEHFERFKLFLKTLGGIDVDFAWGETAAQDDLTSLPTQQKHHSCGLDGCLFLPKGER